jgi:hypothetical protein
MFVEVGAAGTWDMLLLVYSLTSWWIKQGNDEDDLKRYGQYFNKLFVGICCSRA